MRSEGHENLPPQIDGHEILRGRRNEFEQSELSLGESNDIPMAPKRSADATDGVPYPQKYPQRRAE
jgi:hypothetical protein